MEENIISSNDEIGKSLYVAIKNQKNSRKKEEKNIKKVKVLKINTKESIVEGNLVEVPFISYNKQKEPITAVEYTWSDSLGNKHGVEVRGSKYGVPTSYEFDVLIALLRIYIRNTNLEYNSPITEENEDESENVTI